MLPIKCSKCGHIQDAGSAMSPNDICERCGAPIIGFRAHNPWVFAGLSILSLIAAILLGMPTIIIVVAAVLACVFIIQALLKGKKDIQPVLHCEVCNRQMQKLGTGAGYVMITPEDTMIGVGTAEECIECNRVYCDNCYQSRPPNSCVCGRGRDSVRRIGGVIYKGSLRLIKVRYL
jgi:hypothetical protein